MNNKERLISMSVNFIIAVVCIVYTSIKYYLESLIDADIFVLAVGVINLALALGTLANYNMDKNRKDDGK